MNRLTRFGIAAAAIALVVPASGCAALISPQQTHTYQYAAGDGAQQTKIDDVAVRNILLIANDDAQAQLVYAVVNGSDKDARVILTVAGKTVEESVPAGKAVYHNPANTQNAPSENGSINRKAVIIKNLEDKPGTLTDVQMTINGKSTKATAQVLTGGDLKDGGLWYYQDLVPTQGATASATEDATPSATADAEETAAEH